MQKLKKRLRIQTSAWEQLPILTLYRAVHYTLLPPPNKNIFKMGRYPSDLLSIIVTDKQLAIVDMNIEVIWVINNLTSDWKDHTYKTQFKSNHLYFIVVINWSRINKQILGD